MTQIIQERILSPCLGANVVHLRVDRLRLAKRRWRGNAADGTDFGFELSEPLTPGAVIWESDGKQYIIVQEPEPLLEVSLELPASAAAGIGWAIGNLHLELSAEDKRLLTPDDPATRLLLERLKVSFQIVTAVFRPGRFVRGDTPSPSTQELGPSHRH